MTDAELRAAYQQACHGSGAMERWTARDAVQEHLRQTGKGIATEFRRLNLDLNAYFASRPTNRSTLVGRGRTFHCQ